MFLSSFPSFRGRRTRKLASIRSMVSETRLSVNDLVWPVFVRSPKTEALIPSMPNVVRHTLSELVDAIGAARELGIKAIAIFPYTDQALRSNQAEEALNPDNLICSATRLVKKHYPDVCVITDVALDPYTLHGHDGIVVANEVINDDTVEMLCRQSLLQARSGADVVAPSDMMDGRVGAIRQALDASGYQDTLILSYSVKYASALYGPFREAIGSQQKETINKQSYQMDPANASEAAHEVAMDISEGADLLMVKPGIFYLDIISKIAQTFQKPTFVYQVSGEYSMIKNASWASYDALLIESLVAFKRAGASAILTYGAADAARLIKRGL